MASGWGDMQAVADWAEAFRGITIKNPGRRQGQDLADILIEYYGTEANEVRRSLDGYDYEIIEALANGWTFELIARRVLELQEIVKQNALVGTQPTTSDRVDEFISKLPALVIYHSQDDWCGLYRDGKRVFEGHSVPDFELAEQFPAASLEVRWADGEGGWLDEDIGAPEQLPEKPDA